jgi:peptidoglycan-associated lipoprotein
MKRNLVIATLVVFAFSSVFLVTSCAKKQLITEEEEMKARPKEAAKVEEEKAVPAAKEEAVKPEEEAKIERLKELEEAKKKEAVAAIDEEKAWMERRAAKFEAEGIFFDFDKSFIKLEYRPVLHEKAAFLKDYPNMRVRIEGNCDERGTNEYNLALGDRRSNSAKNFLVSLGIAADRIETISYGEERPRAMGHNEDSWSQNRRDDFMLVRE